MTYEQFVLLAHEVRRLQKKYQQTLSGEVLRQMRAKEAIFDNAIAQQITPRNPQQILFESQ